MCLGDFTTIVLEQNSLKGMFPINGTCKQALYLAYSILCENTVGESCDDCVASKLCEIFERIVNRDNLLDGY